MEIDFAVQDCVSIVEKIMVDGMEKALSTCNNRKKPKKSGGGRAQKKQQAPREPEPAAAEAK